MERDAIAKMSEGYLRMAVEVQGEEISRLQGKINFHNAQVHNLIDAIIAEERCPAPDVRFFRHCQIRCGLAPAEDWMACRLCWLRSSREYARRKLEAEDKE